MVHVGDAVGQVDYLGLQGGRVGFVAGVVADAVAHLPGEVETLPVVLQHLHHPGALLVVLEAAQAQLPEHLVKDALAGVAEGSVAQVVAERDSLGQVFVQPQRPRRRPGDAGHLQGVRQPGAVVVALGRDEDLGLVLEPPERLAVDDAVAVALVGGAERAGLLGALAAARGRRALRPWGESRLVEVGGQTRPSPPTRASQQSPTSPAHAPAPLALAAVTRPAPRRRAGVRAVRQTSPALQSPVLAAVFSSSTACAAAKRASGTRYGLQLT